MIIEIEYSEDLNLKAGNVYLISFGRQRRVGSDPFFKLGKEKKIKCLFSTVHTKSYIESNMNYRDWKNEYIVSSEYSDKFYLHDIFQLENAYIVCQFYRLDLDTNIQNELVRIAKDKRSVIVLNGCSLLEKESSINEIKTNHFLVRGKMVSEHDMYKAAGLFLLNEDSLDLRFNIPKDEFFRTNKRSGREAKFNKSLIRDYLKDDHRALGMCGPYDHDSEYQREPNKCHMALQFMDPPIARLCKIIGSMGFRTVYSCVNRYDEGGGTIFCFKYTEDLEKLFVILNNFESKLIYFESSFEINSWMGKKIIIKQKLKEFVVDDEYFWELQRLGDYLLSINN